jgi:hypothetical protein
VEGLTLAGARRKLDDDLAPVAADAPVIDELIGKNARQRLTEVKRGLRAILDLLAGRQGVEEFRLAPSPTSSARTGVTKGKASKGKSTARNGHGSKRRRSA